MPRPRRTGPARLRLALLSDIHANPIALDAVLTDIEAQGGVDACWVLGDIVSVGHDPITCLEMLLGLAHLRCTRGNGDRYIVTGERPSPTPAEVMATPDLMPKLLEVTAGLAWTLGAVMAHDYFDWLAELPLEERLILPDGTRLLGVHAAPGTDEGDGIHPHLSDTDLNALLTIAKADLLCVGHTHLPLDRVVASGRVVNLGSLSNPVTPDLCATYALLEADRGGYTIRHRYVEYDRTATIAAVQQSRHPSADYIIAHLRGEHPSRWLA